MKFLKHTLRALNCMKNGKLTRYVAATPIQLRAAASARTIELIEQHVASLG
jgi:hypothetical protein